jgi:hypothetical protein
MKLIGFTLCKNMNKYKFPIELNIAQHKDLLDEHYFIVPKKDQDLDGTRDTIIEAIGKYGVSGHIFEVDWPTEKGFHVESIDKILQQLFLDFYEPLFDENDWLIKIDADEFHHEKDFLHIRRWMDNSDGTDITRIG